MNKGLIWGFIGLLLLGIIIVNVNAQVIGRISPRCNANGIIDVDYAYKVYSREGYTNYIAILEAGRCKKEFRGRVNQVTNLDFAITTDINAQIESRTLYFYPDPFQNLDVDGRGFFTIP